MSQVSDGIYEEINFRMVFLVKDKKIYRLLFNHVKQSGIISREIESVVNYKVREDASDNGNIIPLTNGFVFKKISTNKEAVNARVKELYHENVKYLNKKFYKRSPSEDTGSSIKTDDLSDVPLGDLTSDINSNSEEYDRLIGALSEQQGIISKLQQESDAYRNAGLEIIEQFRGDHDASAQAISKLQQIQSELQGREEVLRQKLQSYDENLEKANSENEQLHKLMEIDTVLHRLRQGSEYERGQVEGQARARAQAQAQAQAQRPAQARLTRAPQKDRNVELERRRRLLALFANHNKSLQMKNQVLQERLTEVIQILKRNEGGDITDEISRIREQLREDQKASIEGMRRENEITQQRITAELDRCNRRLEEIEAENRQFKQYIEQQDQRCQEALNHIEGQHDLEMQTQQQSFRQEIEQQGREWSDALARNGRQCDADMGAQTQHYQQYQQLQRQLHQQGQQGQQGLVTPQAVSGLQPGQPAQSAAANSAANSASVSAPANAPPVEVAPRTSGLDKPVIARCE